MIVLKYQGKLTPTKLQYLVSTLALAPGQVVPDTGDCVYDVLIHPGLHRHPETVEYLLAPESDSWQLFGHI